MGFVRQGLKAKQTLKMQNSETRNGQEPTLVRILKFVPDISCQGVYFQTEAL